MVKPIYNYKTSFNLPSADYPKPERLKHKQDIYRPKKDTFPTQLSNSQSHQITKPKLKDTVTKKKEKENPQKDTD